MIIKQRLFESYPKTQRFTENGKLIRVKCVIQDSKKVIKCLTGLESMVMIYIAQNMKKNQFALIFDNETEKMYGYISKNKHGIPQRYMEMENLTFKDMYETR